MKIVVLDGYTLAADGNSWDALLPLGQVEIHDRSTPEEVLARSRAATVLVTNKARVSAAVIEQAACLRFIAVSATGFDINDHWRRSMFGAVAARAIAQTVGKCDPEEAFAAALFQGLGALAMFVALGEQYTRSLATAPRDHAAHAKLEHAAL